MADEETPTDGIEGIGFGLTVNDAASPVLKKFEATVNSATKAMVAEFAKMSAASEASTKRLDTANKEHAEILEDESGNVIRSLNDMGSQYDHLADTAEGTVANIEKAFKKSKSGAQDAQKVLQSMAGLSGLGFDALGKRVKALDQALGLTFKNTTKQNEDFTKKFLQKNESTIRRAIEEWKSFGQAVPAQLDKAEKALDSFPKKGTFMKIEDLFAKVKGLSVSNTLIGAAAVGGLHSQYEGAENVYSIAAEGSKTQKMDEGQFQKRREDVATAGIKTGASWQDIRAINEQYSKLAYLGPSSFEATTKAAMDLHRVTGMSVDSSAKLAVQLKQQYNQTDSQVSETTKSIAALSKMSGASADELSGVYDELKFMKFSLDGNAEAAGRLTKATVSAAAGMAKYGLDAKVAIHDVKSVMEGGIDEYQQNLTTMILGGASPEEAMRLLDDIAEGGDKAAASFEKMEKYRDKSVTKQREMYKGLGAGVARAASNDQIRQTTGMTVSEADARSAKDRGLLPKGELEKAQASPEAMKKAEAEATTRRATATELKDEGLQRLTAISAKAATQMYDAARAIAGAFNEGTKGLGNSALMLDASALALLGSAASLGMAALAIGSGINSLKGLGILGQGGKSGGLLNFAKGLFGKAGPALAGAAEGGAALAPAAASAVPGAATGVVAGAETAAISTAATAGTGAAATGAGLTAGAVATAAAAVVGTAVVAYAVGTLIDKLTNKIGWLKKAKDFVFGKLFATEQIADTVVGKSSAEGGEATLGDKAKGKSIEDLKKARAEKWGTGVPQTTEQKAEITGQTDAQRATAKFEAEQAAKAAQAGALGVKDTAKAVTDVNTSLAESAKTTSATAETIEEKAKRAAKDHETMAKAFSAYFDKQVETAEKAKATADANKTTATTPPKANAATATPGVPGSTSVTSTPPMTVSSHGQEVPPVPVEKPKINLAPYINKPPEEKPKINLAPYTNRGASAAAISAPVIQAPASAPAFLPPTGEKPKVEKETAKSYGKTLTGLTTLASDLNFKRTDTSAKSEKHRPGSLHYIGMAADFSVRGKKESEIQGFKIAATNLGFKVKDERGAGRSKWASGDHLHVEVPGASGMLAAAKASPVRPDKATGDQGRQTATPLPSSEAGVSLAASHVTKADTTKTAVETASLASKQEPFVGTTEGDQNVISELRKTNALLARMVSLNASSKGGNRMSSPLLDELNRGGMG